MIDIFTKLSMSIGRSQEDNNELYESKNEENWKLDVIKEYLTTHLKDKNWKKVINQCAEMAKDFGLGERYQDRETWKLIRGTIMTSIDKNKDEEKVKQASKTIQSISDYGCGSSHSYGCGSSRSSRSSDYGCGGSRGYNYGC